MKFLWCLRLGSSAERKFMAVHVKLLVVHAVLQESILPAKVLQRSTVSAVRYRRFISDPSAIQNLKNLLLYVSNFVSLQLGKSRRGGPLRPFEIW